MAEVFESSDLVSLWDRPPEFLPRRPPGGAHCWQYLAVRRELSEVSEKLGKEAAERRVALLAHPGLTNAMATEGLHVGVQMLLAGESAAPHRHTPAALRVGLEAGEIITTVDDEDVRIDPLDVVLNPSGTWHGHQDRGGSGGVWLDVVDLPLVSALGGVLFEPTAEAAPAGLLDPPMRPPSTVRFAWSNTEEQLCTSESVHGVRTHLYGNGSVLPTLAVTAYAVDEGA
ncbi:MAG: cupin domain-containing protein, partial [Actinomycetota bacterium]|nr:cupin domain-containing protein [Actinomycetota bacterium]